MATHNNPALNHKRNSGLGHLLKRPFSFDQQDRAMSQPTISKLDISAPQLISSQLMPPSPSRSPSNMSVGSRSSTHSRSNSMEIFSPARSDATPESDIGSEYAGLALSVAGSDLTTASMQTKIAREGWIYRKGSVMGSWTKCFAVAKHGSSVKPGSLYLYKDDKFTAHIRTIDMSDCATIEPTQKTYKTGQPWEIHLVVRKEDIYLGTDEANERKLWIDALTSIQGKISTVHHVELKSRVASVESANKSLQSARSELENEVAILQKQLTIFQEEAAQRERAIQTAAAQTEKKLRKENEDLRAALDTQSEQYSHQSEKWLAKIKELELLNEDLQEHNEHLVRSRTREDSEELHALEFELRKWKHRAEELERMNDHLRQDLSYGRYDKYRNGGPYQDGPSVSRDEISRLCAELKQTIEAGDFSKEVTASLEDIRSCCEKIGTSWNQVQEDIVSFIELQQKSKAPDASPILDNVHAQLRELSKEIGESSAIAQDEAINGEEHAAGEKMTLHQKMDLLVDLVQFVQISQSRLSARYTDQNEDAPNARSAERQELMETVLERLEVSAHNNEAIKDMVQDMKQHLSSLTQPDNQLQEPNSPFDTSAILEKLELIVTEIRKETTSHLDTQFNQLVEQVKHINVTNARLEQTLQTDMLGLIEEGVQRNSETNEQMEVVERILQHISKRLTVIVPPDMTEVNDRFNSLLTQLQQAEKRIIAAVDAQSGSSDMTKAMANMSPKDDMKLAQKSLKQLTDMCDALQHDNNNVADMVEETRSFIERALMVMGKFEQNNLASIVHNATLDALADMSDQPQQHPGANINMSKQMEIKLRQYESNAKDYISTGFKSMETSLTEQQGVFHEMIKDLVDNVQQLASSVEKMGVPKAGRTQTAFAEIVDTEAKLKALQDQVTYFVNLKASLSAQKVSTEAEVNRLLNERDRVLQDTNTKKEDLKRVENELRRKQNDLDRVRHDTDRAHLELNSLQEQKASVAIRRFLELQQQGQMR